MNRPQRIPLFALTILAIALSACAPDDALIATLTRLPATDTVVWPTRNPSQVARPTRTPTPTPAGTRTATPIPPSECPPFVLDSALPEDASQFPGRHYNLRKLPEGLEIQDSGSIRTAGDTGTQFSWARLTWRGRGLYWIQKQVCRDIIGQEYWEIVDVLALPRLDPASGEAETRVCFLGQQAEELVVAYGIYNPSAEAVDVNGVRGWPVQVQSAWKMGESFSFLDTRDLVCVLEE